MLDFVLDQAIVSRLLSQYIEAMSLRHIDQVSSFVAELAFWLMFFQERSMRKELEKRFTTLESQHENDLHEKQQLFDLINQQAADLVGYLTDYLTGEVIHYTCSRTYITRKQQW